MKRLPSASEDLFRMGLLVAESHPNTALGAILGTFERIARDHLYNARYGVAAFAFLMAHRIDLAIEQFPRVALSLGRQNVSTGPLRKAFFRRLGTSRERWLKLVSTLANYPGDRRLLEDIAIDAIEARRVIAGRGGQSRRQVEGLERSLRAAVADVVGQAGGGAGSVGFQEAGQADASPFLVAHQVILRPLVTEKGIHRAERSQQYAFKVPLLANKRDVKNAVEELFGVRVLSVRTQSRKGKPRRVRFHVTHTQSWKKAIVRLHSEDRINFF